MALSQEEDCFEKTASSLAFSKSDVELEIRFSGFSLAYCISQAA